MPVAVQNAQRRWLRITRYVVQYNLSLYWDLVIVFMHPSFSIADHHCVCANTKSFTVISLGLRAFYFYLKRQRILSSIEIQISKTNKLSLYSQKQNGN